MLLSREILPNVLIFGLLKYTTPIMGLTDITDRVFGRVIISLKTAILCRFLANQNRAASSAMKEGKVHFLRGQLAACAEKSFLPEIILLVGSIAPKRPCGLKRLLYV